MMKLDPSKLDQAGQDYRDLAIDAFIAKLNFTLPIALAGQFGDAIEGAISDLFSSSQRWLQPRRDPLTLDLDGDGIETVALSTSAPIMFDHDGDGVKNGTGWVNSDDGFLVLDRNGNGLIDNGTELFGDATPLSTFGKATDGFAALADQDTNQDGKVNNQDANWNNLRVWRDLNQDGISQANELFTLASVGITGFNVAKTENSQVLPNGNQIADLGTFIKTDGTLGTMGEVGALADVDLAEDTFHREFTDVLPIAPEAELLPDMQGAGKLRDLREATSQSASLTNLLTQYSQATTRQEQLAMLDDLLVAWADTGGLAPTMFEHFNPGLQIGSPLTSYNINWKVIGDKRIEDYSETINLGAGCQTIVIDPEWYEIVAEWEQKIHILESFNGRYFFSLPNETQTGLSAQTGISAVSSSDDGDLADVDLAEDTFDREFTELLPIAPEVTFKGEYSYAI